MVWLGEWLAAAYAGRCRSFSRPEGRGLRERTQPQAARGEADAAPPHTVRINRVCVRYVTVRSRMFPRGADAWRPGTEARVSTRRGRPSAARRRSATPLLVAAAPQGPRAARAPPFRHRNLCFPAMNHQWPQDGEPHPVLLDRISPMCIIALSLAGVSATGLQRPFARLGPVASRRNARTPHGMQNSAFF